MTDNPSPTDLAKKATEAPDVGVDAVELAAQSLALTDDAGYERAGQMLVSIAHKKKTWLEGDGNLWKGWAPLVDAAKSLYDQLRGQRDVVADRLDTADTIYRNAMADYWERKSKSREADQVRRKEAARAVQATLTEQSKKFLLSGKMEEARAIQEQAELLGSGVSFNTEPLRLDGVATVSNVKIAMTDLRAFLAAVARGEVPLEGVVNGKIQPLIEVRESLLKSWRASQGTAFAPDGVTFSDRPSYRVKG